MEQLKKVLSQKDLCMTYSMPLGHQDKSESLSLPQESSHSI